MTKYQVGILFVHGIGQQPEGDTLLRSAEPIVKWLQRWLERRTKRGTTGTVEVVKTVLTPSRAGDQTPPHAELRLSLEQQGTSRESSWLLAESWWGGDVQAPPFGPLARWMLTVGAWLVLSHFVKVARQRGSGRWTLIFEVTALALGVPCAMLMQVLVLALSILALLPIPPLRRALSGLLLTLTGVLGDSYVLLESALQRTAIVNRARESLAWLNDQGCEKIVVVAHSQGAAVAHQALREAQPANVSHLITFGSGLGKLEELVRTGEEPRRVQRAARAVPSAMILLALTAYVGIYERTRTMSSMGAFFIGFVALTSFVLLFSMVHEFWEREPERMTRLDLRSVRPGIEWIDVHASHDLVPNGSLLPRGLQFAGLTSVSVVNLRSWWSDHTSYWENRCEFVPTVVRTLDDAGGSALMTPDDDVALQRVAESHRRRTAWLSAMRWVPGVSIVLLFLLHHDALLVDGARVAGFLERAREAFAVLLSDSGTVATISRATTVEGGARQLWLTTLGGVGPLALIWIWWYGYQPLWRWWDGLALEIALRPDDRGAPSDRAVMHVLLAVMGVLPLLVISAWSFLVANVFTDVGRAVFVAWVSLIVAITIAAIIRLGGDLWRLSTTPRGREVPARKELIDRAIGTTGIAFTLAFLLVMEIQEFRVQKQILIEFIPVLVLAFLSARTHLALLRRVGTLTPQKWAHWAAVVGPLVPAVALFRRMLTIGVMASDPLAAQITGALIMLIMSYFITLGVGHGITWLVGKTRRLRTRAG